MSRPCRDEWKAAASGTCALLTVHFGALRVHARVFPQPDGTHGWFAYREERPHQEIGCGSAPTMQGAKLDAEEAIRLASEAEGL